MEPMRIEVWSDIVCPWCAIGRARLRKALAQAGVQAEIVHRAFELEPSRRGTVPTHEALAERYGSETDVVAMTRRVQEIAALDGIEMRPAEALMANTFDAHRLLLWAQSLGKGEAVMEALVHAHFVDLQDISDHRVLEGVASSCGLAAQAAAAILDSESFAAQVRTDEELASELGVRGVPFFLVADRFGLSGAQPLEMFLRALEMAQSEKSVP